MKYAIILSLIAVVLVAGCTGTTGQVISDTDTGTPDTDVSEPECTPEWECGQWSECADGSQTRSCTDKNDCGTNEGKPSLTQTCTMPEWTEIKTFTGSGTKMSKSDAFRISGDKFKVSWDYKEGGMYGIFSFFVYKAEGDVPVEIVMTEDLTGETYIYEGEADYYIQFNMANIGDWTIKVESFE